MRLLLFLALVALLVVSGARADASTSTVPSTGVAAAQPAKTTAPRPIVASDVTEVEVETDDAAESPAEILRQVTAEQKDVQEYLSFLTQLRAGKGSSPASASAEQPSQADIAEEESSVREYATFLAEVKAKLEAGQAIKEIEGIDSDEVDVAPVEKFVSDLADEEASREAAAGESDSTSASSDSDSEEFDTQQDGGDDDDGGPEAPPTKEEIDKEEALVNRYLGMLAKLRERVAAGEKGTKDRPLPTLAQIADEEKSSREYLAELEKMKADLLKGKPAKVTPIKNSGVAPVPAFRIPVTRGHGPVIPQTRLPNDAESDGSGSDLQLQAAPTNDEREE